MTTVTVLAGEQTIGGTQIVVEDEGARVLFDCGLAFDPAGNPFGAVRTRPWMGPRDLLNLGMAPYVPGLYAQVPDSEQVAPGLPPSAGPMAVALSHSHLDHTHLVGFVNADIPVYASEATSRIVRVLSDAGHNSALVNRPITIAQSNQPFRIGNMRVTLVPVDHDVGGAHGMLIETPEGVIAYSGDLRLHGRRPDRTLAFAGAAREAGARLLILEGTRLAPPPDTASAPVPDHAEADVVDLAISAMDEARGALAVVLLTPENGERVEALARVSSSAGRLLVLDPGGLAFATAALGRPLDAPHAVYLPSTLEQRALPLPPTFAAAVSQARQRIGTAEIKSDPGAFILCLPFDRFADLLDLQPPGGGGVVIHANGSPLGRYDPAWGQLEWWINRLGMHLVEVGSSGHAVPEALRRIAGESGAPVVMAIHSRYPELMPVPPERLLLPVRGRRYELDTLG